MARLTALLVLAALLASGCDSTLGGTRHDGGTSSVDGSGLDAAGLDAGPRADTGVPNDAFVPEIDAGPPLPCDAAFSLSPAAPRAGMPFTVSVTDGKGWTYVDLNVSGPGAPVAAWGGVSGSFTWSYSVSGHTAGVLAMTFTADMGARTIATCMVRVGDGTTTDAGTPRDAGGDAGMITTPPANRFGIGFVGPGSAGDLDLAADLAGPGGYVKLIFPGVTRDTAAADPSWVSAVRDAYARDLIPVIRISPPWGDNDVRYDSDDGAHLRYTALAAAYRRVVEGLPLRAGWPIWIEVHNEPNLCYEWTCHAGEGWLEHTTAAHEYAGMLRDVANALHAIGDPRIRVLNAGLAPGGAVRCECGGDGFEVGVTSREFLAAMRVEVPDLFTRVDAFASHSYPAEGEGWGFFVPYDRAHPGLAYFETELTTIGRSDLGVFLTETGWCSPGSRCTSGGGTRAQIADWTESAFAGFWLGHAQVMAVMPFILRDGAWEDFAWVASSGAHYPVYDRIRALRCARIPGRCP